MDMLEPKTNSLPLEVESQGKYEKAGAQDYIDCDGRPTEHRHAGYRS